MVSVHKNIQADQYDGNNGALIASKMGKEFEVVNGKLVIDGLAAAVGDWFVWSHNVALDPSQGLVVVFEESPVPNRHFNIKYTVTR